MSRIVLCALLAFAAAAHADPKAKPYTSEKLGFTVLFPYVVQENAQQDGTGSAAAADKAAGIMYMVGVLRPDEVPKGDAIKQQLDGGLDGMAKNVKGTIKSTKDVTLGKHPGREALIEFPGGEANFRVFLVVDRVFMVGMVHKSGATPPVSPAEYFASFRLADKR